MSLCSVPGGSPAQGIPGLGACKQLGRELWRPQATDHFADAVLQRGHDGAQTSEFQKYVGQLFTGDATDGILCLVANVVSADGRAGSIHHIVVEGEKDTAVCQETR